MNKKVWFITGASKGLGLSLAKRLLKEGYRVAATSRNISDLEKEIGATNEQFLPLSMNLLDEGDVAKAVQKTTGHFGTIDVLVNNAGYGLVGALEELSDAESRKNFDVNVFGTLNVIRQVMPQMRKQKSGHVFNLSSIGGFNGVFPGFGIYCASKFAVEGLSESLTEEVKPFGIKVTIVSPGYFRTSFLSSSSLSVPANPINDYARVREVQSMHENQIDGNQPGDPDKAAGVLIAVAEQEEPLLHLFLGQDAYQLAEAKIELVKKDMEQIRSLATATDFAPGVPETLSE